MSHAHRLEASSILSLPSYKRWAEGYGVINHQARTNERGLSVAATLVEDGRVPDAALVFDVLAGADRLASAAMWVVVHMTYAQRVRLDGAPLTGEDFGAPPQGRTVGWLKKVSADVGYLAANALSGNTGGWKMGQGDCVDDIEAVNVAMGNSDPGHKGGCTARNEAL